MEALIEIDSKLYYAIKYNQFPPSEDLKISEADSREFTIFKDVLKDFLTKLNNHDQSTFSILSNLMSMWGYNRRYCGMCGRPVIGKPEHIQERLVCKNCFGSYKITETLHKKDDIIKKETNYDRRKNFNKEVPESNLNKEVPESNSKNN